MIGVSWLPKIGIAKSISFGFSSAYSVSNVLKNLWIHVHVPLDNRPDVTTPNGVEELQVFALHVNPRNDVESNCHVDNRHLWRSLNRRPDQHSSKNQPKMITSFKGVPDCRIRRSHFIKTKTGYGKLSFRSLSNFCFSKEATKAPNAHPNACTPNCL